MFFWPLTQGSREARQPWAILRNSFGVRSHRLAVASDRCRRMWVVAIVAMGLAISTSSFAQQPKLPFADPSKMFEQMFGEDSEADRKALENIQVSVADEQQLGKQILQSGLASLKESGIKVESAGRDVEYLQSLVDTLKPFMRQKDRYEMIDVRVARSSKVDARSCPGGTLIFFEGLLDSAGSEAALIGIVGHELAHLDRGHQLLPIKRMKLMEKTLSSAAKAANTANAAKAANPQNFTQFMQSGPGMMKLWSRPFRPEDERDADHDGAEWAFKAGYDPREMAKLFQKKGAKTPNAEGMPFASFFRSHPYDAERSAAILKQANQLMKDQPASKPLFIGKENLKNRFSKKQEEEAAK